MRTVFCIAALLSLIVSTGVACAEDPELPANPNPPAIALAQAKIDGEQTLLAIKVLVAGERSGTSTATTYRTEKRLQNGKEVEVQVPVTETVVLSGFGVTGWRDGAIPLGEKAEVRDLKGKKLSASEVAMRLAKRIPVVLSTQGAPDPFFLANVKPETLVLIVDRDTLFPPRVERFSKGAIEISSGPETRGELDIKRPKLDEKPAQGEPASRPRIDP